MPAINFQITEAEKAQTDDLKRDYDISQSTIFRAGLKKMVARSAKMQRSTVARCDSKA